MVTPCAQAGEKQDSHMVLFSWSLRKGSFLYLPKWQLRVHPSIHSGNFSGMYVYIYAKKNAWMFSLLTVYGSEKTVSVHRRMVK